MSLDFADIKAVWECLCSIHGLDGMRDLGEMDHECIRETLMNFSTVFADEPSAQESLKDMVQVLTVFYNMTCASIMKTEIAKATCWADKKEIFPVPCFPQIGTTRQETASLLTYGNTALFIEHLEKSHVKLEELHSQIPDQFVPAKTCVAKSQVLIKELLFLLDPWESMRS